MAKRTIVVDVGLGNLRSVERALEAAAREVGGAEVIERSGDPERIRAADRVVVPGQGGFRDAARALGGGIGDALRERLGAGRPYYGICLGLQVLFEGSDEAPGEPGLGWYAGRVERLAGGPGLKIPHMGWNALELHGAPHPLLVASGGAGAWFYFVHSFHARPRDAQLIAATASYGADQVTAAIADGPLFASQFHPEKSQRAGLQLLAAFLRA